MKIIRFGADWCPSCLIMKSGWQKIKDECPWLEEEYFDYDANQELVDKYQVTEKLPTFIFVDKNGQEINRLQGEISRAKLIEAINQFKDK